MKLHELSPAAGSRKKPIRVGRGSGSGKGKTSSRGQKGQKSRSGGTIRPGFEGGQMPLARRLPKYGFTNVFRTEYATINVADLNDRFEDGATVNAKTLKDMGIIKKPLAGIKILGNGDITKKLTVQASAFSATAKDKIEKAGGKAEVV